MNEFVSMKKKNVPFSRNLVNSLKICDIIMEIKAHPKSYFQLFLENPSCIKVKFS